MVTDAFRDAIEYAIRQLPEFEQPSRTHFMFNVQGQPHRVDAICPHFATGFVSFEDMTDPFAGRTPSAYELEELFAGGGKAKPKTITPVNYPIVPLYGHQYESTTHRAVAYYGQCPDCGLVLWAMGDVSSNARVP